MPCFPPLSFCKDDCVQVGMVAVPVPLVPSCQGSRAFREPAGRAASSVFEGPVASSNPANPTLCAAPTRCGYSLFVMSGLMSEGKRCNAKTNCCCCCCEGGVTQMKCPQQSGARDPLAWAMSRKNPSSL